MKVIWSKMSKEVFVALMAMKDEDGKTPLHFWCKNGHIAVIRKIVDILKVDGMLQKANRSLRIDVINNTIRRTSLDQNFAN